MNVAAVFAVCLGIAAMTVLATVGFNSFGEGSRSKPVVRAPAGPIATPVAPVEIPQNWQEYVDRDSGYSIKYPPEWFVFPKTIALRFPEQRGSAIASFQWEGSNPKHGRPPDLPEGESFITFGVVGRDKASDETLAAYVMREFHYEGNYLLPGALDIAGQSAVQQEDGSGLGRSVYFSSGPTVYSVFIPTDIEPSHWPIIRLMLSSIKLIPTPPK